MLPKCLILVQMDHLPALEEPDAEFWLTNQGCWRESLGCQG